MISFYLTFKSFYVVAKIKRIDKKLQYEQSMYKTKMLNLKRRHLVEVKKLLKEMMSWI